MFHVGLDVRRWLFGFPAILLLCLGSLTSITAIRAAEATSEARLQKRWLFVWRDMSKPEEVERYAAVMERLSVAGTSPDRTREILTGMLKDI